MPSLAQITGSYVFLLFGADGAASSKYWTMLVGVIFSAVALYKVCHGDLAHSVEPTLDWVNPFKISDASALSGGLLAALFIYWGWDTAVIKERRV